MKMKKRPLGFKRVLILLLCVCMLTGTGSFLVQADEGDDYKVQVTTKTQPAGKYGGSVTIRLALRNIGEEDMHNVRVVPVIDDNFTSCFEVVTSAFVERDYGDLEANSRDGGDEGTKNFSFNVRRDVVTGYYPIQFEVMYDKHPGTNDSRRYDGKLYGTIYVRITGNKESEDETDKNIKFTMGENQETPSGVYTMPLDFNVEFQNRGAEPAYDVEANLILSQDVNEYPFEIAMANYDKYIGTMEGGAKVNLPYSMVLREDVKTGYYPLKFEIIYRDEPDGDLKSTETIFYVKTKGEEEEETSTGEIDVNSVEKPRLIISGYSTDPEVVMSGDEFMLTLHMQNTSKTITAKNILFTLEAEQVDGNAVFTPLSGSTSVVIDAMSPGQTVDIVMPMAAKAGVQPKSYTLKVKEKYDVEKLKSIEDEASVAIPVKQVAKLSVNNIEVMPESIDVGGESNVMFGINNTGKITLYNVTAAFFSDGLAREEAYVGNIEPGNTGNVDVMLRGIAPNDDSPVVTIVISYEDDAGVVSTAEKEFDLYISEAFNPEDFDFEGMETFYPEDTEGDGGKKWLIPVTIAGSVVLLAAVIAGLKIRKKRKGMKEEEGLADEIS